MGVWETKSGELASSSSYDFERRVLHLLRAFWPEMIRPRETQRLDRNGIDLLVWSDDFLFPCVVQCKGLYQDEKLIKSQWPQIEKSIDAFLKSPFSCTCYVLVHNRTREEQEVHKKIEDKLATLRAEGKAQETILWDRQTLIKETKKRLQDLISERLADESAWHLNQQKSFFKFGELFVSTVPLIFRKWVFESGGNMYLEHAGPVFESDISGLIASPKRTRWTLLIGYFGTGKTTTALRAAAHSQSKLIYVRCQDLPNTYGGVGTNNLLQNIIRSFELYGDWEDDTRLELERLSTPVLAHELRNPKTEFAIIIDGIDESHTYSIARGITQLTNELADLKCPIILTTRKEHFETTFGNYEAALEGLTKDALSMKGGQSRNANVFELQVWSDTQVFQFLQQAIECASLEEQADIKKFTEKIRNKEIDDGFRELVRHPLFLQMMLELASDGMVDILNRIKLIEQWITRKIKRDLSVCRRAPIEIVDKNSFIDRMMILMEKVAFEMTAQDKSGSYLLESTESSKVQYLAASVFETANIDISTIVTTSVLVPGSRRLTDTIPIRFYHRIFHEYFLARYVLRHKMSYNVFPNEVIKFCTELGDVN